MKTGNYLHPRQAGTMQNATIRSIYLVGFRLCVCLLLAACTAVTPTVQTPTPIVPSATPQPTPTSQPTLPPTPTFTPTSIPLQINSVSAEPRVVKNGETFRLTVTTSGEIREIAFDISQVDKLERRPIKFFTKAVNPFSREFLISFDNFAANGTKPIKITAADKNGQEVSTTVQVELQNPPPELDKTPLSDDFNTTHLDLRKWIRFTNKGERAVLENGRLCLQTITAPSSRAMISSTWGFSGDFDIQVDFASGEGWGAPVKEYLDEAVFGVVIDGSEYSIKRQFNLISTAVPVLIEDTIIASGGAGNQQFGYAWNLTHDNPSAGKFRLVRIGSDMFFLYDRGDGWLRLHHQAVPPNQHARVYLEIYSPRAGSAFTTYFDNFIINSGHVLGY
jgi:hypothetical protein